MPPINMALTATVTVQGQVDTQIVENVYSYRVIAAPVTATKINDLAAWWLMNAWPQMRTIMPAAYTLLQVVVKSTDPGLVYERVVFPTTNPVGSRPGDPIYNVTAPILWKSGTPTRSGHGRTSIGPVNDNDLTGQHLGGNLVGLIISFAAYLLVQHPAGEWILAIGSRKLHVSYGAVAAVIEFLNGSMRTRLERR